jgi:hypothetical protein
MPEITYEQVGREVGELVTRKQAQYGDSFAKSGEIMRVLYPDGISDEHVHDALVVVRIIDKLFRIATGHPSDTEDPWTDIAGYSLLKIMERRKSDAKDKPAERKEPDRPKYREKCWHCGGPVDTSDNANNPTWQYRGGYLFCHADCANAHNQEAA